MKQLRIGITGSIACGKSTVSDYLKQSGYSVIDADAISRELTSPSGKALDGIRHLFGDEVFVDKNHLNRSALAAIVFSNPSSKSLLEQYLHPLIIDEIRERLDNSDSPLLFADIPLLFECNLESLFDEVWVVSASEEIQIERLCARDGLDKESALKRIRAQMPLSSKIEMADSVIDTNGSLADTYRQVDALLSHLPEQTGLCAIPDKTKEPTKGSHTSIPRNKKPDYEYNKTHQKTLSSVPFWLRMVLIFIVMTLSLILVTLITQQYMTVLEERRRLEVEAAEKAQHPLYYRELIEEYATEFDLDPALVSSVILCESSFDPHATSRLGARGLMQLMEETARWVAHKLNEDDQQYTFDQLWDPETNIRYGSWYLSFLSKRFDRGIVKVICAYHAGQGNVDAWLKNPSCSSDGITLEHIPTADTALYCKRVLAACDIYKKYYFVSPTDSL